ncbi:MAG: hypothetical protein ACYDEX_25325, partial [Mobilitalea sp.]
NYMHGEKLLGINDCFCSFSRFYVWDNHYIDIFNREHCKTNRYIVENIWAPLSYLDHKKIIKNKLTYYLQIESTPELNALESKLLKLKNKYDIYIRPHPRSTDLKYKHLLSFFQLDNSPIEESLETSEFIVGKYSTVLLQAYYANKKVVIDDCTNPLLFKKLKECRYILTEKNVLRLSEL